jgi:hypothetical protein
VLELRGILPAGRDGGDGLPHPIVSTDVHGIAELIGQRQDGYLVKPGDAVGLSQMMQLCLAKERSGKSLTPTAYSKALRFQDASWALPMAESSCSGS